MAEFKIVNIVTGEVDNIIILDDSSSFDPGENYSLVEITGDFSWDRNEPENLTTTDAGTFIGSFFGDLTGQSSLSITSSYALKTNLDAVDHVGFDTASLTAVTEGTFVWNDGDGTLDLGLKGGNVILQLGQEQIARVYNAELTTLNEGEIVYIFGSQGNRISVKRADNTNEEGSRNTLGMVTEPILSGLEGFVTTAGVVHGLNTSGSLAGATLFLSSSGKYTTTKPTAPYHTVIIGFVERVHQTAGSIFVKVDNGYEIGELHDIIDTSTTSSYGDLLVKSGSIWTNSKTLSGSYDIQGDLTVSGLVNGSSSYALSSSYVEGIKSGEVTYNDAVTDLTGNYIWNVTFDSPYQSINYSVNVNSQYALRVFTIPFKTLNGFTLSSNSSFIDTGSVFWTTISYNS
jgi:hypothetical protein